MTRRKWSEMKVIRLDDARLLTCLNVGRGTE